MSAVIDSHGQVAGHHDDHHHAPHGWRRWVYATNHKDIGTLYLLFSFTMLIFGGILALLIRAELFQPGLQLVNPELFNQLTTMHGLIMVFGANQQSQNATEDQHRERKQQVQRANVFVVGRIHPATPSVGGVVVIIMVACDLTV